MLYSLLKMFGAWMLCVIVVLRYAVGQLQVTTGNCQMYKNAITIISRLFWMNASNRQDCVYDIKRTCSISLCTSLAFPFAALTFRTQFVSSPNIDTRGVSLNSSFSSQAGNLRFFLISPFYFQSDKMVRKYSRWEKVLALIAGANPAAYPASSPKGSAFTRYLVHFPVRSPAIEN